MPRLRHALRRLRRFTIGAARRFYADGCLMHASALAYASLLSLVPFCALMFAVLKGLGVQRRLEPLLLSRLALEPDVVARIVGYIDRTNVGTLGALGAAALVLTVVSVLGSVEQSFNHIWRVRHGRTWWRKITDYLSTVLLTPLMLLAAVAMTSALQEEALLGVVLKTEYVGPLALELLRLAPVVINAVALLILYAIMPNRRPFVPGILLGAVAAGWAWQGVQWGYVTLQIGVARYNAIYGALSQLPVTLVWLYLSWSVVLAGAELAAAYEFAADTGAGGTGSAWRWAIALQLLIAAAERFREEGGGVDPRRVARQLRVDTALVVDVADSLRERGLLAAVDDGATGYVLARDPRAIGLNEMDALLETDAVPARCDHRVRALFEDGSAARHQAWGQKRLADLLGEAEPTR
jgi:membrane protein